ncbi:lysostaphin resistance A-like protein [Streptococcus hillyeri]|uniref:CPBP family intramembrane metalloprotease n=1 Tax=Streptococcus hillyeri TaxID=2282420 RepID=A0A3L9DW81_9STRE|nr:type II CAAX endopeptidase family protein [Streptococcus hillyeri]RLY04193.1 CPBP family intramembrane metalloprotease [Streptococcus hillyeri]
MLKKFLRAVLVMLQAIGLMIVFSIPEVYLGAIAAIKGNSPISLENGLIYFFSIILFIGMSLIVAHKRKWFTLSFKGLTWKNVLIYIVGGFALFHIIGEVGYYLLSLSGEVTTANEIALQERNMRLPLYLTFTITAFKAPIVEEVVFRGFMRHALKDLSSIWYFVFSTFSFALLHSPTNLASWFIYGSMGLVLAIVYDKTKRLEYGIGLHLINNIISQLSNII